LKEGINVFSLPLIARFYLYYKIKIQIAAFCFKYLGNEDDLLPLHAKFINMFPHHIKNGFYLGLSCVVGTFILYLIGIDVMLLFRSYLLLALYIFWMRRSVKDKLAERGDLTRQGLFASAWMTFVLGVTISVMFINLLANYGDQNIIFETKRISAESNKLVSSVMNISPQKMEEIESQPTFINPYGLRAFATMLPLFFILPGALIAMIMSFAFRSQIAPPSIPQD
jgi:hypothetical protein